MELKNPFVHKVQRHVQATSIMFVLLYIFSSCARLLKLALLAVGLRGTMFSG